MTRQQSQSHTHTHKHLHRLAHLGLSSQLTRAAAEQAARTLQGAQQAVECSRGARTRTAAVTLAPHILLQAAHACRVQVVVVLKAGWRRDSLCILTSRPSADPSKPTTNPQKRQHTTRTRRQIIVPQPPNSGGCSAQLAGRGVAGGAQHTQRGVLRGAEAEGSVAVVRGRDSG